MKWHWWSRMWPIRLKKQNVDRKCGQFPIFTRFTCMKKACLYTLVWVKMSLSAVSTVLFIHLLHVSSFPVFSFIHPIFPHPSELNLFNYSRFLLPIHIAAHSQTHTSSLKPLVFVTVFISWRRLISLVWLAFSLGFEKYWYSIDANKWLVGVRGLQLFISSSIWYFIDVSQWKNTF